MAFLESNILINRPTSKSNVITSIEIEEDLAKFCKVPVKNPWGKKKPDIQKTCQENRAISKGNAMSLKVLYRVIKTYWRYSMFNPLINELNSSHQISYPGRQRF